MNATCLLAACLVLLAAAAAATPHGGRGIPSPRPGHPGNVFVRGEEVVVALPSADGWRLLDYDDHEVARVAAGATRAALGRLPVGFYRLRQASADAAAEWVSLAVVEPLHAPTPRTSPIASDVAMAWFYQPDRMDAVASLCALAGLNRVRDRLSWGELEPERGRFSGPGRYDASARAQSRAGLQVLQVNHASPGWANPDGKRFPLDLRDAYRFYREIARRWKGEVGAIEPWNEADIPAFGGHTGAEMAAMQKASYLGLKAGNPNVTACLNVFAVHNPSQLADLNQNQAWPYFETYNLHHYEGFQGYPALYADHRAVSAGRPMWVSECAMPVRWSGDPARQELSDADLREQSERLVKTFAGSLHEGSAATFYFILGHYVEGQTQFGIVRRDLTPRPAFLSLAAVGRLLADARPVGRLRSPDAAVQAYVFRARPDGSPRTVVVAWAASGTAPLVLPAAPQAVYDHLGRPLAGVPAALTAAPVFVVLPASAARDLPVEAAPAAPRRLGGTPSPVVLQALAPSDTIDLRRSAYKVPSDRETVVSLFVYNFGDHEVSGTLRVKAPEGWHVAPLAPVRLEPMGRAELKLAVDPRGAAARSVERVVVTGDFGAAGRPVLSVRLAPSAAALSRKAGVAVQGALDAQRWVPMISGGAMRFAAEDGGLLVDAEPGGPDRWVYPRLPLPSANGVPQRVAGLACDITLLEGEGLYRAIFDEANGSSYVADLDPQPKVGETVHAAALLDAATHGAGWSADDPNGRLDPGEIVSLKVGCNTSAARVRYRISNLRWVER